MKAFLCLAFIVICNIVVNQAAVVDIHNGLASQFDPNNFDGEVFDIVDVHSRQRRQSNQASIDVQRQRGGTSVNAQVGRVWESNNGNTRVEANANYGRDYGRGGSRPNYGGNIQFRHRF